MFLVDMTLKIVVPRKRFVAVLTRNVSFSIRVLVAEKLMPFNATFRELSLTVRALESHFARNELFTEIRVIYRHCVKNVFIRYSDDSYTYNIVHVTTTVTTK